MADEQLDPSDFKKDELKAAAAVQGVDVPKSATKADIAAALNASQAAEPVVVDNRTARTDEDARLNSWVDVVAGEHEGRRGAYVDTVTHDASGFPERVLVRTRDADNLVIECDYSDLRPSDYTGGR